MQSVLSNESWAQILQKFAACSIIVRHCQEHNLLILPCFLLPIILLRHVRHVYDEESRSSFV